MEENEELTTSYANSEPSLHNAPITPAEDKVMRMVLVGVSDRGGPQPTSEFILRAPDSG